MNATSSTTTVDTADLAQLEHLVDTLEEALIDAQMAADERGWVKIGDNDSPVTMEEVRQVARRARVMAIADPLIRRAVNLRIAYVWGSGLTVAGAEPDDDGQDVNAVVQAFLVDQAATFASPQACEERERALMTSGNVFLALITDPVTGRVQVRGIPMAQVDDIVTDPEDAETPWFYKRTYAATVTEAGYTGTRTRRQTRTVYYPALGHKPRLRPRTIDGHEVRWSDPVLHVRVNRPEGSVWGTSDLWAALDWATGYRDFLVDWARLVKALSRFAFRATAKSGRGAGQVRERITATEGGTGSVVVTPEGQKFEAIGKSGATIDSHSGLPLASQAAAATDVPVTMLTSDPGQTGARATAETLDKPLALITGMRRSLGADVILTVLHHVVDSAIKAPRGPLTGVRTIDQLAGTETYTLTGDQARGLSVDWPDISEVDVKTMMDAITAANDLGKLDPLLIARLALVALHVDDVDGELAKITDPDTGELVDPNAAADADAVAQALAAFRRGDTNTMVTPGDDEG